MLHRRAREKGIVSARFFSKSLCSERRGNRKRERCYDVPLLDEGSSCEVERIVSISGSCFKGEYADIINTVSTHVT